MTVVVIDVIEKVRGEETRVQLVSGSKTVWEIASRTA